MSEPSEHLRQLAAHGRKIRAEILALRQSQRHAGGQAGAAVDLFDFFFDLSGYKRTARKLGKICVQSQAAQRERELMQEFARWATSVKSTLGKVSAVRKGLCAGAG